MRTDSLIGGRYGKCICFVMFYILRDSLRVSVHIKWLSLVIIAPSTFLVRLVILESTFQYD